MNFKFSLVLPLLVTLPSLSFGHALTSGRLESRMALDAIFERQTRICTPVEAPVTCARSCGPGYTQCVAFPHCYNPSVGQVCCSDGTHCPAGYYCTDTACCPNGSDLASCGATQTLSVIPPPVPESTTPSAETTTSTSVVVAPVSTETSTTVVVAPVSTTTVEGTTTSVVATEAVIATEAATTSTTTETSASTTSSRATATPSQSIVVQTTNAAPRQSQAAFGLVLGGVGLAAFL